MKKIISKILICAMLISVLPKTSFAHEEKVNTTTVSEEQKAKAEEKVEKKEKAKAEKKVEAKAEEKVEKKEEAKAEEKVEQPVTASLTKARATEERYTIKFRFDAIPDSLELPQAVLDKLPKDIINVANGTDIHLPKFDDVEVEGGKWKFLHWEAYPVIRGARNIIDGDGFTVNGSDLVVIGKWGFEASYFVEYAFKSITAGKELPQDILVKLPKKQTGIPAETEIPLPKMTDVKVDGGTWKFVRWSWGEYYRGTRDDGQNQSVFVNQDLLVTGEWKFEKDPEPKKYNVTFEFKSVTAGKELPQAVMDKLPPNQTDVVDGTMITLPTLEDVKVEGGTWKFVKWLVETDDGMNVVQAGPMVQGEDLKLVGEWRFEADKKPEPPKPQKPKVEKGRMLPKTNVDSALTYVILALAGIGGAYIAKKKDEE